MLRLAEGTPIPLAEPQAATFGLTAAVLPNRLGIQYVSQLPNQNLCWAACCQMVLGPARTHTGAVCGVASHVFGMQCCPDPRTRNCDWPADITAAYKEFGINAPPWGSSFREADLVAHIEVGRYPIQLYFLIADRAHTSIVVDSLDVSVNGVAAKAFRVYDPWYGGLSCSYDSLRRFYGHGGLWTDTYYGIGVPRVG